MTLGWLRGYRKPPRGSRRGRRGQTPGPQEAAERPFTEEEQEPRSWWRRMFGG